MKSTILSVCGSAAAAALLQAGGSMLQAAEGPEFNARIEAILQSGGGSPYKGIEIVKQNLEAASALAPRSVQPWYAASVVHIKHHRHKDALAALDKAKTLAPNDPFVARAKAWVLLWQKEYPAAIVELERLGGLLRDSKQEITPSERVELAGFMGRAIVFMEGPASKSVKAPVVGELKAKLTEMLPTATQTPFKAALEGASEQALQEALELEQTKADELAKDAQKKAENLEKLSAEAQEAEKKQEELSAARAKVEEIFQDRAAKFEQEIAALQPQFQAAERNFQASQQAVLRTELDINNAFANANAAKEDRDKNLWNNEAQRLQIIRQRQLIDVNQAQAAYASIGNRLQLAVQGRTRLQNEYAAQQKSLGMAETKVGVAMKRINRETAKNSQAPTGANGRTLSQKKLLESFPAAEPFPFDRERARLEALLGVKPAEDKAEDAAPTKS